MNDGRGSDESSQTRKLSENFIFRRIFAKRLPYFKSSNMAADVVEWKSGETQGNIRPFQFPDQQTPQYYRSLFVFPIEFEGTSERGQDIRLIADRIELLLGFLSIDSPDRVEFGSEFDLKTGDEFVNGIVSSFFEYFRCVKHLENRVSQS